MISACSLLFRNLLKDNQSSHPLIYLRRVKYNDIQNLLTFMYQGEVNVWEEDLPSFLEIAEDLLIKGLSKGNREDYNSKQKEPPTEHQNTAPSTKRKRTHESHNFQYTSPAPKRKEPESLLSVNGVKQFSCKICDKQFSGSSGLREHIASVHEGIRHTCTQCDYTAAKKSNLTVHVQSIHEGS